ncbi:MAG: hypothetical protein A2275_07185 [Bacteroidetes bacterium RIFOXYA12_FULL_35_11]|nr:MAG: hypothetical protein A2X01_04460 [Bacteroidetes bacterium GWF2_35_48]OFY83206.1 MAG: hypothetical protein A2275_07185 [Bacteroidetes bacterium RIFOXYA12_FULL_35_11]HBX53263.1 hypothetical protein [Bacteroidales bacterium]
MAKRIIFGFIVLSLLVAVVSTSASEIKVKEKINSIISQLQKKYAISFVYDSIPTASWKDVNYSKTKTKGEYKELLSYLKIFSEEFNKYPPSLVKRSNLKYVAFVRILRYGEQHRSALPDAYKEILFLDVLQGWNRKIYEGRKFKYYIKHTLHHEFYHMVEQEINGNLYYKDSVWNSFNPTNFEYGKGGAALYPDLKKLKRRKLFKSRLFSVSHPCTGLITKYSGSALEEDKAEVFTSLFIKREIRKVKRCIKNDEVIAKKVNYMKQFLLRHCKEMDDNYWNSL